MVYEADLKFNRWFLPRLHKQILKKKFFCTEHVTDDKLSLKVDIFNFNLTAKPKDELESLLEEVR